MFVLAFAFNQELKDWNVSSGTSFVSHDESVQCNALWSPLFGSVSKLDSELNPLLNDMLFLKEEMVSTNYAFHYFYFS